MGHFSKEELIFTPELSDKPFFPKATNEALQKDQFETARFTHGTFG